MLASLLKQKQNKSSRFFCFYFNRVRKNKNIDLLVGYKDNKGVEIDLVKDVAPKNKYGVFFRR